MVAPHALGCCGTALGSTKKGISKIVTGWRGSLPNVPEWPH
jgi:hypothetical protein